MNFVSRASRNAARPAGAVTNVRHVEALLQGAQTEAAVGRFTRSALSALVLLAAPTAALAQQSVRIFLSPMGQPFQGEDGMQAWITAADTDHDGKVSLAEFAADASAFFARVDANQDQSLTSVESTALLQREAPQVLSPDYAGPPIDPHQGPPGRQHRASDDRPDNPSNGESLIWRHPGPARHVASLSGAGRFGLFDVGDSVMSCDTDFSGRVTVQEFSVCAARRFSEIDADHDGAITIEEARAKRAALVGGDEH